MTLPEKIETDRLVLRPFNLNDAPHIAVYANNPNFSRFLPMVPQPYTQKDSDQFIARRILEDSKKSKTWAITVRPADVPMGGFSLRFKNDEKSVAEMGWSIAEQHWGKGLTTEGVQAIIDAAFTHLPSMHKIRAGADLRNVGSWRVMEKVGMQREALFRQHQYIQDEWIDDVWYGILRSDWETSKEEKGKDKG